MKGSTCDNRREKRAGSWSGKERHNGRRTTGPEVPVSAEIDPQRMPTMAHRGYDIWLFEGKDIFFFVVVVVVIVSFGCERDFEKKNIKMNGKCEEKG